MSVGVGYFSDPAGFEGLTHFLGHMLFYANEKYPVEDSYSKYITERTVPARSQVRNFGHITQIANKLIRLAHNQRHIPARVQEHGGVERDDENYMRRAFKIYLDLLKNLKEMLIKGYENVVWGRAHSRDLPDLVEYES
ncbi:Insulinase (Peptidase family M16) family protein [Trifolium repens]|nr:Insulinase (Peptidase family M16) family protein [Trifolium repens]